MSYVVLARKYRPRQFSEMVGQNHVATTLLNAFKFNKLGQAYLLTGTRGVGKTSIARILAKALRCENPDSQPGGKNPGVSCDRCPSCLEIHQGAAMDVLEIDGASNNGVENVREIRDQVKFLPSKGKTKVYIIDEVHMLTNSAFNALLKTLEEPPAHVTFILATTEAQKIPATILSRCQRFDFRRVPQPLIEDHLGRIAGFEQIQAEPGALRLIARKADGSVRDALSALDQCLALGGKTLTTQGVTESLGIVSASFLVRMLAHALRRELVPAAELVQQAFAGGVEMKQLAIGLAETLRNALFVKYRAGSSLTEVSAEESGEYEALVKDLSPETIQAAYRSITVSLEEILRSPLPRTSLEMALARLAGIGQLRSLEELLLGLEKGSVTAPAKAAPPAPATQPQVKQPAGKPALETTAIPVYRIPNPDPLAQPEKKNPEPARAAPTADALNHSPFTGFVRFVLQQKPSLGALLEHSVPISPAPAWASESEIRIGFRKSHAFYQLQAQHKANFEQLEHLLQAHVKRKTKLTIETAQGEAGQSGPSIQESEKKNRALDMATKRQQFLAHEIARSTTEIFGAELSSFDIDKAKT